MKFNGYARVSTGKQADFDVSLEAQTAKSAARRLALNIMVSVLQWEHEAIRERTKDEMATLVRRVSGLVWFPSACG